MSTKIPPSLLTWVDSSVLSVAPIVDKEYVEVFRRHHRLCESQENERNYEIIVADPGDRIFFPPLENSEHPFFYAYECLFTKLGIKLPFFDFETNILWTCNVTPSQLHQNSWAFLKIYQLLCQELDV
ncbi:hypothetical protein AHAS_Ahas19G0152800 [Arachis hypogaea]